MLAISDRSSGCIVGVTASGKLTHQDYEQPVPKLEELIHKYRRVRVLFDLADCHGWELGAAWHDLKFGLKHGGEVERCAVVGEARWQEAMTKLSRVFFNVRYFDRSESEQAWRWLREGADECSAQGNVVEDGPHKKLGSHTPGLLAGVGGCQQGC
jgi:hypothetical protein